MRRRITYLLSLVLVASMLIVLWNYWAVQRHLSQVIEDDSRNSEIEVFAHYKWFVNPQTLVFDLRNISGEKSPMDVSRTLFQFSEKLKDNSYESVILSYKGNPRFTLKGTYFHTLGAGYGSQNPVYTLRTLPENVYNLNGSPAFGTWTGGWLGVLGKQMEDFKEFHNQWYITSMSSDD